ncbi:bifunctional 3'-5' exonuclease/DNA polymerase [Leucobacter luti]|nr:bifunctional 3'-5' exonuclease/DNA polymerase [Leucobacter luti]MBL3698945.1 bifunctional 3'-5' exonuclease/DNA polymerase [Leucobacter luti]
MLGESGAGGITAVPLDSVGAAGDAVQLDPAAFPAFVAAREAAGTVRWVWSDTPHWYPRLLDAGVCVSRCHDLRLSHAILAGSERVADPAPLRAAPEWDAGPALPTAPVQPEATLFDFAIPAAHPDSVPHDTAAGLAEFARQRAASGERGDLRLLLAAESAGALIAIEMATAGLPWDTAEHDRLLQAELGPRPAPGAKPARMVAVGEEVRAALGDPSASLDSPPKLVRALRRAGIDVASTSQWELMEHEHPAIAPLLHYKKLARLLTANGWTWLDEWVHDGRYRPVYVPGGVVTGRWASSGGGALQLPRQLRPALRADPGWRLVSADVAQLEPRVLAAYAGDRALAAAARGTDLYSGIVATGAVATREEAKYAVLGAMYGATTGEAGRLAPRLRRAYPTAMGVLDRAATTGETGGRVATRLGRTSPSPAREWLDEQAAASLPGATPADEARARRAARELGRFTRNFIVQGTAAEWALAWLGGLRGRLAALPVASDVAPARASGAVFERRAHLVFFLHDEVIVHAPAEQADAVAAAITAAAADAGELLFPGAPIDFPLDLKIAERSDAK